MEEAQVTLEEIAKTQGTRKSDLPPWMTYAASFDEKLDPKLEEEVKLYSEKRHEKSSQQNEEEFCKQKEFSDGVAKQYAWLPQFEYKDDACRVGKVLTHSEFINRLRNECKLNCYYTQHPQDRKLTLLISWKGKLEVGCWVQWGQMPEYSMCRFDDHGVILDEKFRGYRTCLLQLILKGFLTEATVNKVFGPAVGPASNRYNSTLYSWRNSNIGSV